MMFRILVLLASLGVTSAFSTGQAPLRPVSAPKSAIQMGTVGENVATLVDKNSVKMQELYSIAPDMSEVERLRFAIQFKDQAEAQQNVRDQLKWRAGAGKTIVESAAKAVAEASAGGAWDNEPVRMAAPHAATINPYITPKNILTIPTDDGDLVYVIRASLIDDKKLMDEVSVEQLTEFLLYVKEVHSLIVNAKSKATGRLCGVIFANDITGIRSAPDPRFSKALTESSKSYEKLYPSLAGPTMILNLPFILQAFVGLLKPLFPKSVQDRLKFTKAPVLAQLSELTPLTTDKAKLKEFLDEVKMLLK